MYPLQNHTSTKRTASEHRFISQPTKPTLSVSSFEKEDDVLTTWHSIRASAKVTIETDTLEACKKDKEMKKTNLFRYKMHRSAISSIDPLNI